MVKRENVFTQFARDINNFANHIINKEQLFERFVDMIELCGQDEKEERKICKNKSQEYEGKEFRYLVHKIPYSNYEKAKKILNGIG